MRLNRIHNSNIFDVLAHIAYYSLRNVTLAEFGCLSLSQMMEKTCLHVFFIRVSRIRVPTCHTDMGQWAASASRSSPVLVLRTVPHYPCLCAASCSCQLPFSPYLFIVRFPLCFCCLKASAFR